MTTNSYLQKTHTYDYLSEEQETELVLKMQEGSLEARDEIIHAHLRSVYNIARQFARQNNQELEDLLQEGNLGLLYAADNFDPSKNVRFNAYSKMWVKEFIKRRFYKNLYALSTPFRVIQKSFQFENKLSHHGALEEEKKVGENISIKNILKAPLYFGTPLAKDSNITLDQVLQDPNYINQEDSYEISSLIAYIKKMMETHLSEKEQFVFYERYFKETPTTYKDIGASLKVSKETARGLEKTALKKIKHLLK